MPDHPKTSPPDALQTPDSASADPIRLMEHADQAVGSIAQDLDHLERLATLGTISASVAHEINNLLTPVIAYAQLARSRPDDTEMLHKALQKASGGAEAVSAIARAMLTFARPDQHSEDEAANVRETVDQALACLARHPSKDGIRMLVKADHDCDVQMQPLCLQQVMMNLIANAVQAMKRSKIGDSLTVEAVDFGRTVELRITDNGPGMPPEVAEHVFAPFKSGSPADSGSQSSGFGLGLWICQRLVEQAGGSIRVRTAPNQGSTFTLTLPASPNTKQNANISRIAG